MNAMTCLETLLTREQAPLRRVAATLRTEHRQAHPPSPPKPLVPEQQRSERRARRYARYEQVVQLKAQDWSQRAIAQETGLHPQTVAIYLKAGQFPECAPHPRHSRVIEPYLDYLCQRWEQVLPLTVVDNSTITPICLTVISDALSNQEAFSFSHFKRRGLYEHAYLFVLALNLPSSFSRAALAS